MANAPGQAVDRVGPFVAGSTLSDLIGLVQTAGSGLHLVSEEEQSRDHYRQRFSDLQATAREFFFDYEGATSVVFEKTGESELIPDFIQYVYCWFAADQLGGVILFGVDSDAGTHEEIDQREIGIREQAAEVVEALGSKYTEIRETVVNYFNFQVCPSKPRVVDQRIKDLFSGVPRLVTDEVDGQSNVRVDTHYWGPTLLHASDTLLGAEAATNTAHSSQTVRRIFANEQWYVVCTNVVERYVRTIESLHGTTKLVYLSRTVMDAIGQKLNAELGAKLQEEARVAIARFEESRHKAQETKRNRIARLSRIL